MSETLKHIKNHSLKNRIAGVLALTAGLGACDSNHKNPQVDQTNQTTESHDLQWKMGNVTIYRGQLANCDAQNLNKERIWMEKQ